VAHGTLEPLKIKDQMDMEHFNGKMEQIILEHSKMEWYLEQERFYLQINQCIQVNLKIIMHMGKDALQYKVITLNQKEIGKMEIYQVMFNNFM
jgi:hypothetical protein